MLWEDKSIWVYGTGWSGENIEAERTVKKNNDYLLNMFYMPGHFPFSVSYLNLKATLNWVL